MNRRFKWLMFTIILATSPRSHAGHAEAAMVPSERESRRIVCEYALTGRIGAQALAELKVQFFERPFTVYHQHENIKKSALVELGLDWLRESKVDHLVLKARGDVKGISMIVGVPIDEKWLRVLSTNYLPDDFALWRKMNIKVQELNLTYQEIVGAHPAREPNFSQSFSHPIGFHSAENSMGVRKFLEISDVEYGTIAVTLGIDVNCKDTKNFVEEDDETMPLHLKTPTKEFCRIPILTFSRPRLYHAEQNI